MSRRYLLRVAKKLPRIRPGWPIGPHPLAVEMAHVNQWFHAMSYATRTSILEFLSQRERSVTELGDVVGVPQSTVSYHLKVLRESGLVREHREGRRKYFGLHAATLEYMAQFPQVIGPGKHVGTCPLTCCR
jgi:ArsR family transcriptional regulator, arsenate/arsenite/antimonite-responsive transcriptional repressor